MGQYYKPISVDAEEFIYTHDAAKSLKTDFCGLKLMEHSWMKNKMVRAVLLLLSEGEAWHKTRIVWAGDYADSRSELQVPEDEDSSALIDGNYNSFARHAYKQFNPKKAIRGWFGYLLNHDTNEYVCLKDTPEDEEGWQIHPLPLLTCEGNGRGGGDFRGDEQGLVGRWCEQRISFQREKPSAEFEKLDFTLVE